jgi:hypothetical protein
MRIGHNSTYVHSRLAFPSTHPLSRSISCPINCCCCRRRYLLRIRCLGWQRTSHEERATRRSCPPCVVAIVLLSISMHTFIVIVWLIPRVARLSLSSSCRHLVHPWPFARCVAYLPHRCRRFGHANPSSSLPGHACLPITIDSSLPRLLSTIRCIPSS